MRIQRLIEAIDTRRNVSITDLQDALDEYVKNACHIEPCWFVTLVSKLEVLPSNFRAEADQALSDALGEVSEKQCIGNKELQRILNRSRRSKVGTKAAMLIRETATV